MRHIPGLPAQIQSNHTGNFRGARLGPRGKALAVTHDTAVIWDYLSDTGVQKARTFALSHVAKPTDPLPLGCLVTSGLGNEIGLVVVNATNGRISFWENVEDAEALNLFEKRRNGAEGSCGGMLSGETVTDIEEAGSAGFVLSFSSGRTAQLLVRDAQSRPAVSVSFLRAQGNGFGFLNGLKTVLGGAGLLKPVAAVRNRTLADRECAEVIIGNEAANFQYWRLSWSDQPSKTVEIDARAAVDSAILPLSAPEMRAGNNKIVDFTITPDPAAANNILALVEFQSSRGTHHAVVEIDLDPQGVRARRAILLKSYSCSTINHIHWKPRICLLPQAQTAVIVFENAITVQSLITPSSTPNSQFLMDLGQLPEPFQDTVYFRDGSDYIACGSSIETFSDSTHSTSAIVFVNNFGLIRVEPVQTAVDTVRAEESGPSAKSKIEQAVFFGSLPSNPLNLTSPSDLRFSAKETEDAAVEISREILATESPYIVPVAASMSNHLDNRAKYLHALAVHVLKIAPDVSRPTRWRLRFDAEKMAAAQVIWKLYDALMHSRWREMRMLPECLRIMNDGEKTAMDRGKGEHDRVRLWCTKDVGKMSSLLDWMAKSLDILYKDGFVRDDEKYLDLASECNDVLLQGLAAAYEFRSRNAALYGLEHEPIRHQILDHAYEGLPDFWTSPLRMLFQFKDHLERLKVALAAAMEEIDPEVPEDIPQVIRKLYTEFATLSDAFCRGFEERISWLQASSDEEDQNLAADLQLYYIGNRKEIITNLIPLPQDWDNTDREAANLAEKWGDMEALVDMVSDEAMSINAALNVRGKEAAALRLESILETRIAQYFQLFGPAWGDAMFSRQLRNHILAPTLDLARTQKEEVTRFLRARASRAKLCWINDVMSEREYVPAAESLMLVAETQETALWSKKVEMSLAKLALLSTSRDECDTARVKDALASQREGMQVIEIQEKIQDHIRPSLYDAVDQPAELQLAMEIYGKRATEQTPTMAKLLEHGLKNAIEHRVLSPERLIDVLTLMNRRQCSVREYDISGQETFLALLTLKHSGLEKDRGRFDFWLKIIWKRCFVNDDWAMVNRTDRKMDADALADLEATGLFKAIYEGHMHGKALHIF